MSGGALVTPLALAGRPDIRAYGEGRFRIGEALHEGSVLILPDRVEAWAVAKPEDITPDSLAPLSGLGPAILTLGCGETFLPPPAGLREALKAQGLALEWMDTGAACRTFNLLLADERPVLAALIAVK